MGGRPRASHNMYVYDVRNSSRRSTPTFGETKTGGGRPGKDATVPLTGFEGVSTFVATNESLQGIIFTSCTSAPLSAHFSLNVVKLYQFC